MSLALFSGFTNVSTVPAGSLANAELTGAKMVNGPGPLSVSTRPAAETAATNVVSCGLFEAAVAAGSWAIPFKLPLPVSGMPTAFASASLAIASPALAAGMRTLSTMNTVPLAT